MKITLVKKEEEIDISQLVGSVSLSGGITQISRQLELEILKAGDDIYMPKVDVELGNMIEVEYENKKIFSGYIFKIDGSETGEFLSLTVYDPLIYIDKSDTSYKASNKSPESIAKDILSEFKIPSELKSTNTKVKILELGKSCYEIIMKAYSRASDITGKKYMLYFEDGKVKSLEVGEEIVTRISPYVDLINSDYSMDIEGMVNKIRIEDDKGNVVDVVEDSNLRELYGTIQKIHSVKDDENSVEVAKSKLKGIEKTASIEALGNINCTAGKAVIIDDEDANVSGLFYIESDSHKFENGLHTMSLELNFEKIMDYKEGEN